LFCVLLKYSMATAIFFLFPYIQPISFPDYAHASCRFKNCSFTELEKLTSQLLSLDLKTRHVSIEVKTTLTLCFSNDDSPFSFPKKKKNCGFVAKLLSRLVEIPVVNFPIHHKIFKVTIISHKYNRFTYAHVMFFLNNFVLKNIDTICWFITI
jgi:hypothetical protein